MRAFLFKRPLLVLLVLYTTALIILDAAGYFRSPRSTPVDPASLPRDAELAARVLDVPEQKPGRTSLVLGTESIDRKPVRMKVLLTGTGIPDDIGPGDILQVSGSLREPSGSRNPGGFDYANYLRRSGIRLIMYPYQVVRTGEGRRPALRSFIDGIRTDAVRTIEQNIPEKEASVLVPMLLGDKSSLTPELKSAFVNAGVMHVLVVSGLNVAYCSVLFLWLFRFCGLPRRRAALLTIPFILAYMLLTGANPPVVRATVMALFVIISLALSREPLISQSLGLAAFTILLFDPQALFTPSFQLSFAATLGIVYLSPVLLVPFDRLPSFLKYSLGGTIAVSFAAQLAVLPLSAYYFNKISLSGFISNLVVVPLVGIITAGGFVLYLVHFVSLHLTKVVAFGCYGLLHFLLFLVESFSRFPASTIHAATPSLLAICTYYSVLWGAFHLRLRRTPVQFIPLAFLAVFAVYTAYTRYTARDTLAVTFLDVGNGDAIHIRFPGNRHWLVDGGGGFSTTYDPGLKVVCPYLWSTGVSSLEKIIITHPHRPHYAGLKAVVENFTVGEVITNAEMGVERDFAGLMELLKDRKVPVREAWAGDRFVVGASTVSVVSPGRLTGNPDDNVLVLLVEHAGRRVLLTGDMGKEAEENLAASPALFPLAAVALPGHGRRTAGQGFITTASADYYIVSGSSCPVIGNDTVFLTGKHGAVTVTVDREGAVRVKTHR